VQSDNNIRLKELVQRNVIAISGSENSFGAM